MNKELHKEISQIKSLMERSTRYFSLSGWAGILAGIYALIGAYLANDILNGLKVDRVYENGLGYSGSFPSHDILNLLLIAAIVFVFSVATGIITSYISARKSNEKLWSPAAKKMIFNMMIPLSAGGIFAVILIIHGYLGLVAPATLIFYGLSLLSASYYTYSNIKILGIAEIILGLLSSYFVGSGLLFWSIGFGLFHILYGTFMYLKYRK